MTRLSPWDYLAMLVYLAATLALGLWIARRTKTGKDFFLAGRQLPWWAIGFSLVATDIGGTDIIGVGGASYSHGLVLANLEWIGCIPAMLLAAFVFVPIFWRSGVYTIPEFMERRFNVGMRMLLSLCWLVFMACNVGVMLIASSVMMRTLFGWEVPADATLAVKAGSLLPGILLTAALVGVYTLGGGLAAVVYTDVLQCVVMIAGCLLVLVIGVYQLGGVAATVQKVEQQAAARWAAEHPEDGPDDAPDPLTLILPVDSPTPYPWTGVLFGLALVLGPAYWIGNQAIVQRTLGAKSEYEAKAAYIWGAVLKNIVPIVIAVPGLIALAIYPQLEGGSDTAIPTLVAEMLPAGARGMFVAAFLAALMSSVDSYVNSAATLVTNDFYTRFLHPEADERRVLRVGRIVTAGVLIWGVAFAGMLCGVQSGIYAVFQTLMAFFQGPSLAVILTGFFWPRATGWGAVSGFVSGVAVSVLLFLLNVPAVCTWLEFEPLFHVEDSFLYISVWSFLAALGMIVLVSLYTRPEPAERIRPLVYHPGQLATLAQTKAPPGARVLLGFATVCAVLFVFWTQIPQLLPPHFPRELGDTPLHDYGTFLRYWFSEAINMRAARWLFLSLLLLELCWILTLPRDEVVAPEGTTGLSENLRLWASMALLLQVVIYSTS